jgi:hypothetical protein
MKPELRNDALALIPNCDWSLHKEARKCICSPRNRRPGRAARPSLTLGLTPAKLDDT